MAWMSVDPCKTLSKVAKPRGSSLALKKKQVQNRLDLLIHESRSKQRKQIKLEST